jgi:hypothetical protein
LRRDNVALWRPRILLTLLCLHTSTTSVHAEGWTLWLQQVTYGLDGKPYGRPGTSWLTQGGFQTVELCDERLWAVTRQALKDDPSLESIGDTPLDSVTLYKNTPAPSYSNYFCRPDTEIPWALPKRWVLWEHHSIWTDPDDRLLRAYWVPGSAYRNEGHCKARERFWQAVEIPDDAGKAVVRLKCFPDTFDPRRPKRK